MPSDRRTRTAKLLAGDPRNESEPAELALPSSISARSGVSAVLLGEAEFQGRLVSADAMFCQREICQQIVDSGGDYLIGVKDNQLELKAAIEVEFRPGFPPRDRAETSAVAV